MTDAEINAPLTNETTLWATEELLEELCAYEHAIETDTMPDEAWRGYCLVVDELDRRALLRHATA